MLVYRWEDPSGVGCFQKGICDYFLETNMTANKYDRWVREVHDRLPLPSAETWETPEGDLAPSIKEYFDGLFQYMLDYNIRFAFKSYDDALKYIPEEWHSDLLAFGCQLVCYEVFEDEGCMLISPSQVVYAEDFADYKETIIEINTEVLYGGVL